MNKLNESFTDKFATEIEFIMDILYCFKKTGRFENRLMETTTLYSLLITNEEMNACLDSEDEEMELKRKILHPDNTEISITKNNITYQLPFAFCLYPVDGDKYELMFPKIVFEDAVKQLKDDKFE